MVTLVISIVAFAASALTFFSGFGLGTVLLPAFALFFPVEQAVAVTAVVHGLNGLFKLLLTGRHVDWTVLARFGLPAIVAAAFGALLLERLAGSPPIFVYEAFGRAFTVTPVKFVVGLLLFLFATLEVLPSFQKLAFPPRFMPLGGLLSGFFGGVSGMQGALRSAFLVRAGLSPEAFIATGAAVACLVDLSRIGVYAASIAAVGDQIDYVPVVAAVTSAFAGALLGRAVLGKVTMRTIQTLVAVLLCLLAIGLVVGLV